MRVSIFLLVLFAFATNAFAFELPLTKCANPIDCAKRSVVSLLPQWPENATRNEEPEGSGIVVGDGKLIATADHVLGPATDVKIRTHNGIIMKADIVLRDPLSDLALLKPARQLKPFLTFRSPEVPEKACAIGNAFGLDLSVNCGVISAKEMTGIGFNPIEDFLQTDAAVNPGMSGGALVDQNGALIGMLSAIFTRQSDANIGVNFAVSSDLLLHVVSQYSAPESVNHRQSGVLLRPNNPELTDGVKGALVVRIDEESPEAEAGLQVGDVIITADGRRIKRKGAYETAIALAKPNEDFEILVLRGKKPVQITLKLK